MHPSNVRTQDNQSRKAMECLLHGIKRKSWTEDQAAAGTCNVGILGQLEWPRSAGAAFRDDAPGLLQTVGKGNGL